MDEAATRDHVFEGVFNFRDVGGIAAGRARRVRRGILYRSDALSDASVADLGHVFHRLGVRRVIDLRAERELAGEPVDTVVAEGIARYHRPIDRGPGNAIEGAPEGERLAYRYLEYLEASADAVTASIRDFAGDDTVTLVHCRAGKDRTGVVLAALLSVAGASDSDIAADYALTAQAMPAILARLAASATYSENVRKLPPEMYSAEDSTMRSFLALVQHRCGGFAQWARAHGVSDNELAAVRETLTESVL